MGAVVSSVAFPVPDRSSSKDVLLRRRDLLYLTTADDDTIPAVHIRRGIGADRTIIYSHSNAEDLGIILPLLDRMAEACVADVFAYEYPGYSIAEGVASEENCYLAIDAAYEYLVKKRGIDPSRIVVYGRSIGTGPTVDLVARNPEIRGMVLLSPIESCGRAIFGKTTARVGYNLDIFRNYEKLDEVECPVLVMHGTADEIVPWHNGRAIHRKCRNSVEPLWVPNCGHNNMPEHMCFHHLREFLDQLDGLGFAYSIFRSKVVSSMMVTL